MLSLERGKSGKVTGTGAVIPVLCGFTPRHVRVMNIDGNVQLDWTEDMGAGKGFKHIGGTESNGFQVGIEFITTGGITVYADADSKRGFSIGADTDLNVLADDLIWIAYGD